MKFKPDPEWLDNHRITDIHTIIDRWILTPPGYPDDQNVEITFPNGMQGKQKEIQSIATKILFAAERDSSFIFVTETGCDHNVYPGLILEGSTEEVSHEFKVDMIRNDIEHYDAQPKCEISIELLVRALSAINEPYPHAFDGSSPTSEELKKIRQNKGVVKTPKSRKEKKEKRPLEKSGFDDHPSISDEPEALPDPEVTRIKQEIMSCEERLKNLEVEPTRLMRLMCQAHTALRKAIQVNKQLPKSEQKNGVAWQVEHLIEELKLSKKRRGYTQKAKDLRLIVSPANVDSEALTDFMEVTLKSHLYRRCTKEGKALNTQDELRKKILADNENINNMSMYVVSAITNIISTKKEKDGGLQKLRTIKKR